MKLKNFKNIDYVFSLIFHFFKNEINLGLILKFRFQIHIKIIPPVNTIFEIT